MGILSLLNDVNITHFGQTFDISINFIGEIIKWLVGGVGVVGVGIILFSLILKLIVLPFDVMQRVSMRKQNQKMKENQEKLEKLQKQYANDKQKYNEKMMEFYKSNGISMFASCLPMILSMVIFFVAIGAFNSYSQYANVQNYNHLAQAYNETIESYTAEVKEDNLVYSYYDSANSRYVDGCAENQATFLTFKDEVSDSGKYIYVRIPFDNADTTITDKLEYSKKFLKGEVLEESNGKVKTAFYFVDTQKTYNDPTIKVYIEENLLKDAAAATVAQKENACKEYFLIQARVAAENTYHETVTKDMGFLWIKNIWQTDAAYKHPLLTYSEFSSGMGNEKFSVKFVDYTVSIGDMTAYTQVYEPQAYEEITKNLSAQQNEPNGYFILIVLSIGTILLQQFISMRSQKAQSQFSTVDGQGGSQQKMMLVIMTIMFAV
ncbi:MAG: YidC/Oxa1 family membrane protein insertase, partial [Clostridia bacterium]|nr:YidC/Oxa1 family membrane protein insertase [Clostridia bacterium]